MLRFLTVLILFALVPLGVVATSPPADAAGDCSAVPTSLSDALTAGVWQQLMARRASYGLPALGWSTALAQSSAWMARDRAARGDYGTGDLDSLGRTMRTRDTDCGYRSDAQVGEAAVRLWTTDPVNIVNIWAGSADPIRLFQILHSSAQYPPVYTVGALGRWHDSSSGADYWVMDVGTLADSGAVPTSVPTATSASTPTPIPTATPSLGVDRQCVVNVDIVPGEPFTLSCDR
jgi:uncharacterized protein YkwD